jgi:hypothetical protein
MSEFPAMHPELIDNFTFDQVAVFLQKITDYRKDVPRADVSLANLVHGFLGEPKEKVKESTQPQLAPRFQMTKEEINAFCNEGMPSPVSKWLKKYRRQHGTQRKS